MSKTIVVSLIVGVLAASALLIWQARPVVTELPAQRPILVVPNPQPWIPKAAPTPTTAAASAAKDPSIDDKVTSTT
jgi:hypothetical protein